MYREKGRRICVRTGLVNNNKNNDMIVGVGLSDIETTENNLRLMVKECPVFLLALIEETLKMYLLIDRLSSVMEIFQSLSGEALSVDQEVLKSLR
ncbi:MULTISPECIES: hypothetical protein [Vagococcus]|nr:MULTISPECIES: hypothetical protein [Vagococcus]RHH68081.1 hypothetical protein DW196_08760 [Vagococcus sp. AM17-17]